MRSLFFALIFPFILISSVDAQEITQVIRGVVLDRESKQPIPGANIIVVDSDPLIGAVSDEKGIFRLEKVPVGRQSIKISYIGYHDRRINDMLIKSSKEVVLDIEIQEKIYQGDEFVISAKADKREAINKMATVSARTFSVEESQKYAGSLNDVARMAQNFAGVQGTNDNRNDLIIRGNSSIGVLYRLDGVDIPNPNHFALMGSTGGPISILNNNTLKNSDFYTGAFPAQYGNAIAGVFDLQLREGNDEKFEFIGQIGFNGAEILAEGPFSKKRRASYLVSYRYSTLDLFKLMGVSFGTLAVPEYQDMTIKLNFPLRKGKISAFMIGGFSDISFLDEEQGEEENFFDDDGENLHYGTNLLATGVSYTRLVGKNAFLRATFSSQISGFNIRNDSITPSNGEFKLYENLNKDGKLSGNVLYNHKLNTRNLIRAGIFVDQLQFDYDEISYRRKSNEYRNLRDYSGNAILYQPYFQWQLKISEKLVLNSGVHYQYFDHNGSQMVEPRLGLKWNINNINALSLGVGRHSQVAPSSIFFRNHIQADGTSVLPNENLGLLVSDHVVLGYDRFLSENLRLKIETYYQNLSNVPVDVNPSTYSLLNQGANFVFGFPDSLDNDGSGRNYGLEFTLEQFLSKGFYFLITASLFDSKYTASDGKEYSTAFNSNYNVNALLGKEWELKGKHQKAQHTFAANFRGAFVGGQRFTPVDLTLSRQAGFAILENDKAFSGQYGDYMRFDIRINYRRNGRRFAQEMAVDLQNFIDRKNVYYQEYNPDTGEMMTRYQLGFLPVAQYRIYF